MAAPRKKSPRRAPAARRYFGTDGIRGRVNESHMTAATAMRLGAAAGKIFQRGAHKHRAVIGKDTRISGYMVESALVAGLTSMGLNVFQFGPIPTPAVGFLTRTLRADLGVMISASHNGFHDNGIKLFGPDGYKLSDELELKIEGLMDDADLPLAPAAGLGRAKRIDDAQARYIEFAKRSFPRTMTLEGVRIAIDCAHGAAYKVAPTALWELGADVVPLGVDPNGFNINRDCGALSPEGLQAAVREHKAHIGLALDGDADRLLVCDERGRTVDGDQLLALLADDWHARGALQAPGIVATIMSNLGLEHYLTARRLALKRTQVGDRYVVAYMRAHGYNLGGEQSGHVILRNYTTTGDGLIAALQVLGILQERQKPVSEVLHCFDPVPQFVDNIGMPAEKVLTAPAVQQALAEGQKQLGRKGRLLMRKSGTEPILRIMGEGENEAAARAAMERLRTAIEASA